MGFLPNSLLHLCAFCFAAKKWWCLKNEWKSISQYSTQNLDLEGQNIQGKIFSSVWGSGGPEPAPTESVSGSSIRVNMLLPVFLHFYMHAVLLGAYTPDMPV